MSVLTIDSRTSSRLSQSIEFLHRLLAAKPKQAPNYQSLKSLPDYLLLDIGVDPRNVPGMLENEIARPDIVRSGNDSVLLRTSARS